MRRGICRPCKKTFTILPDWLTPSTHYSLHCRRRACERIASGDSVEQAAPHCKDPSRLPDSSTVRRWAHRRLRSIWSWVKLALKAGSSFSHPPSLPGILARFAIFCRWRQRVRDPPLFKSLLGRIRIEHLLREVDDRCRFTETFRCAGRNAPSRAVLLATLIAHGTNLGISAMGYSAEGITVDMLRQASQ